MSLNYASLTRYARIDEERAAGDFIQAMRSKEIRPEETSIRRIFEAFIKDGASLLSFMWHQGEITREAADAVNSSQFANITGQLMFSAIKEAYESPAYIWPMLVRIIPTMLNGERIPGIGRIGDASESVNEGEPFPYVGVSEEWIDTPATLKHGCIVPITREAIFFDRTGILIERCRAVADVLAVRKEKEIIDLATGQTNNYKYKDTASDTYQTTSPWVNIKASNALTDWTDIENAELLFDAMTDPTTAEPIIVRANTLIVPTALRATARRITRAVSVTHGSGAANAADANDPFEIHTEGSNPLESDYMIASGPYVKARTSSATTWFIGEPKRAFAWMQNWPLKVERQTDDKDAFDRDIIVKFKAHERGKAVVTEPRRMVKNTA